MSEKLARKYFLGQEGVRLGCAQAVAQALKDSFSLDEDFVRSMAQLSGGRAPSGYCGAIYAALRVAEEKDPHKKQEIEDFFKREAGGVTCRDVRSKKKLLCAECVEQAARILLEGQHSQTKDGA